VDEEAIFVAALECATPEKRRVFVKQACAGDAKLQALVEGLLQAHDNPDSFLQAPAANPGATIDNPISERPGTVIGPYKLMEQIGEGGMGLVFVAEQHHPVRRKVALKVIKPGMDTRHVVARFEAERQALALMDHANIAKALDGGQTAGGRPYFVMELVKGVPITDYCDQNQVPIRQRLELFLTVCQAVQHAHQKGIIHRDIKPSNVLVASHDGVPIVKIIDFGVAKAVGQQLTERTIYTQFTQMIGTPLYMSPEQAGQSALDVDTRSDIYSLGVLLYELLTGTTPFDRERLKEMAYEEIRRIIREEEPPRPSHRISTLGLAATTISTQRKSDPKRLSQLCRGELDWIVMKALEKDRNRRYETASAFAADVQRYLHDEPVQACPPSGWYRFRKFARRNQSGLAVAGLILFFLVLLGSGVGWALRDRAVRQVETERKVTAALVKAKTLLAEGDKQTDHPERWLATNLLALAALEKAEELLAPGAATGELVTQVEQVRAAVDAALADSRLLVELDRIRLEKTAVKDDDFDHARAAPLYAKALGDYGIDLAAPEAAAARVRGSRLREALLAALADWSHVTKDEKEQRRVATLYQLALPANSLRPLLMAAIKGRDGARLVKLTKEPAFQELPPTTLVILAQELAAVGEWAAAERLLRAGLERKPGDFWLNHDLGMLLLIQKPRRADEAVVYLTAARALRSDSPGVHLNLGNALNRKGDLEGAIRRYRAALRIDPKYADAHYNLGIALYDQGRLDEAIKEYREVIGLKPDFAAAYTNLGHALSKKGQFDEAIAEYQWAIRLKRDYRAHNGLGNALLAKGRLEEAIAEFQEAVRLKHDAYEVHMNLGEALRDKGRLDEAIKEHREALRLKPDLAEAHDGLGVALQCKGLGDQAIKEHREALRLKPDFAAAHTNLGHALSKKGQFDEAIAEYQWAIRLKRDYRAHNGLGNALLAKGRLEEAIAEFQEAVRLKHDAYEVHINLGEALRDKGRLDEAIKEHREALRLKPDLAEAHDRLGVALQCKGLGDQAIKEHREALRLKPDFAEAHNNLGTALLRKGQPDEAIQAYREALRLKPDFAEAHYGLGVALLDKARWHEAIVACRAAIRLKPTYAEARCNLGHALKRLGRFTEALAALKTGHQLGSERPGWRHPSAAWVRAVEQLIVLDTKLSKALKGESQPANAAECAELGWLCQQSYKQLNAAAARFFSDAFAGDPKLADDLHTRHRYNAACAAALAGCGQGKDAGNLKEQERARLRRQALDWLQADLAAWRKQLQQDPGKARSIVLQVMQHWQRDADFAGVRGLKALVHLSEAERLQWQKLWADVEALHQDAAEMK
jgi:tetratricopeptide (TPR) repeat protein/serine/threonine protein kinase